MNCRIILMDDVIHWLDADCHPEPAVRRQIKAKFAWTFGLLGEHGVALGRPHIAQIKNHAGLWEVRVEHTTGAYRAFFGTADERIIVVSCGAVKKADRFPSRVYEWAAEKVRKAVRQVSTGQKKGEI